MKDTLATFTLCAAGCASSVALASGPAIYTDPAGDAVARPTSSTAPFDENALPDLLSLELAGWNATTPAQDRYTGQTVPGDTADLFRLQLVFDGLVNPPGPVGLGAAPWQPFRFGATPVYGFIELNVDRDRDSGGELGSAAKNRYLANAGRFARRTSDSIGNRLAENGADIDGDFFTEPFFERSGAEFDFGFCGCFDTTLLSQDGNMDGVMDDGETFDVSGRFFRRVASFLSVSGMEGGSFGGLYDPIVPIRFQHDIPTDRTTVTFIGALTMAGAAQLAGEPEQQADFLVDNHWSVYEAVYDIIDGAEGYNGPASPEVATLISRWAGTMPEEHLDPTRWRVLATVGTTYTTPSSELFVWSDTGFEETAGDFDGDAFADSTDEAALAAYLATNDGSVSDADGVADGVFTLIDPGENFSIFDITGDFIIDQDDLNFFTAPATADFNSDGMIDAADLAMLLANWGSSMPSDTDLTADGIVDASDLALLLAAWGTVP